MADLNPTRESAIRVLLGKGLRVEQDPKDPERVTIFSLGDEIPTVYRMRAELGRDLIDTLARKFCAGDRVAFYRADRTEAVVIDHPARKAPAA